MEDKNLYGLEDFLFLEKEYQQCGIVSKEFSIRNTYGKGKFVNHYFDGLLISFLDVNFSKSLNFTGEQEVNALELSILLEGEKIINIATVNEDLIQESLESYMVFVPSISGEVTYHKEKPVREIKIRMLPEFIEKHQLDTFYAIKEKFSLQNIQDNFAIQLSSKTQDIITELLTDNRKGILKRLFLESKVLELLSLQIDTDKTKKNESDTLIKKLYNVQHIINTNLHKHYAIPKLAREVLLNDFVLKKEFKRVFRVTIFEYVIQKRMEKARELLIHTNKPIYEIADLVGYKNATHFSAAFKKVEQITPKVYRKKNNL